MNTDDPYREVGMDQPHLRPKPTAAEIDEYAARVKSHEGTEWLVTLCVTALDALRRAEEAEKERDRLRDHHADVVHRKREAAKFVKDFHARATAAEARIAELTAEVERLRAENLSRRMAGDAGT